MTPSPTMPAARLPPDLWPRWREGLTAGALMFLPWTAVALSTHVRSSSVKNWKRGLKVSVRPPASTKHFAPVCLSAALGPNLSGDVGVGVETAQAPAGVASLQGEAIRVLLGGSGLSDGLEAVSQQPPKERVSGSVWQRTAPECTVGPPSEWRKDDRSCHGRPCTGLPGLGQLDANHGARPSTGVSAACPTVGLGMLWDLLELFLMATQSQSSARKAQTPQHPRLLHHWRVRWMRGKGQKGCYEEETKNKNRPHQPTIKFTAFLPIKFLPLLAPP